MPFFINLFGGADIREKAIEQCYNVSKSFLEIRYNKRIREKFIPRYKKKYANECIHRIEHPPSTSTFLKVKEYLSTIADAIALKNVYAGVRKIPSWVSGTLTKENFLKMLDSVPTDFSLPEFPETERVLNFIWYCVSFGVSWPQYFLAFKEGRDILYKTLFQADPQAILALLEASYMVGITKSYDEYMFRKDLYQVFPDVEKYLFDKDTSVTVRAVALFLVGKISFTVFKKTLELVISKLRFDRSQDLTAELTENDGKITVAFRFGLSHYKRKPKRTIKNI